MSFMFLFHIRPLLLIPPPPVGVSTINEVRRTDLGQVRDLEADGLGVFGARVEIVADEQDQFQQFGELFAVAHLLAGRRRRHNVLSPRQQNKKCRNEPNETRDGTNEFGQVQVHKISHAKYLRKDVHSIPLTKNKFDIRKFNTSDGYDWEILYHTKY